jgi:hypothetical protein
MLRPHIFLHLPNAAFKAVCIILGISMGAGAAAFIVCWSEGFPATLPAVVPQWSLIGAALGGTFGWMAWLLFDGAISRAIRRRKFHKLRKRSAEARRDHSSVNDMARANNHVAVEIISAIIVISTIAALVAGIMFPNKIPGAVVPMALAAWYVLYRTLERIDVTDKGRGACHRDSGKS